MVGKILRAVGLTVAVGVALVAAPVGAWILRAGDKGSGTTIPSAPFSLTTGGVGPWEFLYGLGSIFAAVTILLAVGLGHKGPRQSAIAITVASLLLVGLFYWLAAVTVPLAVIVIWAAFSRANALTA